MPQHCDCCRTTNAPYNTISLDLMFASHGSKQRPFLIPAFLDLIQVLKEVVAQMVIGHSARTYLFHLLAKHWDTNKTPVV